MTDSRVQILRVAGDLSREVVQLARERIAEHSAAIQVHRSTIDQTLCAQEMLGDSEISRDLPYSVVVKHVDALKAQKSMLTVTSMHNSYGTLGLPVISGVTGPSTAVMMIAAMDAFTLTNKPTAATRLKTIQDRYLVLPAHRQARDRVITEMGRLSLTTARCEHDELAATHLDRAWGNFEGSAADEYATHVLVPMRSCVNACLASLLARRPIQEKTNADLPKPLSILQQCGYEHSSLQTVRTLADQYRQINDELSKSKDRRMSREHIGTHLFGATEWLASFLGAIDHACLRQ